MTEIYYNYYNKSYIDGSLNIIKNDLTSNYYNRSSIDWSQAGQDINFSVLQAKDVF